MMLSIEDSSPTYHHQVREHDVINLPAIKALLAAIKDTPSSTADIKELITSGRCDDDSENRNDNGYFSAAL